MKKFLFKIKERWMHYCLFWSWNIIALIFLFVIIFPFMFWDLISASLEGSVPWNFAVFSYLSIFVLLGSVIIGLTKFRGEPKTLTKFFYGVETPLLFVFLLRLTLIREITFATGYLILIFILTTVVYFINLFRPKPQNKKTTDIICLIFDTIIGIFGLYLGLILIFYVLPFAWILLKHFFSFEWVAGLWELIFQSKGIILFYVMIGVVFIGFSSTVFIVLPFALIKIYITHFVNSIKKFAGRYCRKYAVIISILTLTTVVILFSITNNQPQKISFQLLKKIVLTDKDKLYIIDKSEIIKKGLVNAYLAPYRYLSSIKENNHIAMMYRETFDMNKTSAQRLQDFYNILTLPFLYKGNNLEEDRNEAEKLYAEFFDQSIMKGERNAINRAVSSTYQIDSIEAGLVDIDKSIVHLNRQTITVKEKKGFSEIEIFEIYENTTFRRQEILYYFELPENAVITGLWINDTENRD
ncbi:MAG TPA: TIGR02921 family PEP-CTERM protein, partial [bacterium]|nr:TIGR02921 family PEP-CTERM protein [bacterium]